MRVTEDDGEEENNEMWKCFAIVSSKYQFNWNRSKRKPMRKKGKINPISEMTATTHTYCVEYFSISLTSISDFSYFEWQFTLFKNSTQQLE